MNNKWEICTNLLKKTRAYIVAVLYLGVTAIYLILPYPEQNE